MLGWPTKKRAADLERELRSDLELEEEEQRERGLPADEARCAARRAFGNEMLIREQTREAWGWGPVERVLQDFRYAARSLRKSPGFAVTALGTLALGIGAVTSVFSVVDAVLLKPFAFRDPGRLVVLRETIEKSQGGPAETPNNYRHMLRVKTTAKTIEDIAIFGQHGASVSLSGDYPRVVGAVLTSPNLFQLLGVQPILGRGFVASDAAKGANAAAVLSYEGWQTFFAGDPEVVGKTLHIDGEAVTVVGVLPANLRFPQIAMAPGIAFQDTGRNALIYEALVPSARDLNADMGNFNYKSIARLRPGATLAQASAELDELQRAYAVSANLPFRFGMAVTPLMKDVASGIRGALWLLFAAVGAVLLIACVNLANLQLARATRAEHETAIRSALGASKVRLMRSRLAESLVLAVIGGGFGVALAFAGVRLLLALVPAEVPRLEEVRVNLPVLAFAVGISMLAAIAFGILPALRSLRVRPQGALQAHSSRLANTAEGFRTRNAMVAVQVACTIVLLIVSSLALRSFSNLLGQNRGFDADHVTLAETELFAPQFEKGTAVRAAYADRVVAALRQLPGVESVALTSVAPLTGETWVDNLFRPDHPVARGQQPSINVRWIDPGYLPTMQTPLVAGRNFTAADRANPHVALISERTAREGFLDGNPIGRKIVDLIPDDKSAMTIVGVVADTRINGLKDNARMVYLPYWAYTPFTLSFLVRSSQASDALIPEMRRAIWQIDPQVAIPTLRSMDHQLGESVATDRFQAMVLASFGAAALLLALLGIYGVLAYSVSLRQQEFGIRMALGSSKAALVRMVLQQAAIPVLAGTGAGLVVAFLALRFVGSELYQTPVMDPLAIGGSVALLLMAATLAAMVPAGRAASVDPMRSLRVE